MITNKRKMIVTFIFVCFIGNLTLAFIDVEAAGTISFVGTVKDSNGNPISGATVALWVNSNGGDPPVWKSDSDTTDGSGQYSVSRAFTDTVTTDYSLIASKTGYVTESIDGTTEAGLFTHNFVLATDTNPSVSWVSPADNALVTFEASSNDFVFEYTAQDLDTIDLLIGPTGTPPTDIYDTFTTMGTDVERTTDLGSSLDTLHGMVRADLKGYVGGILEVTDTRTFNFSKVISQEVEMLEEGTDEIGSELYLIIYDPPGDQSYSTHTVETSVTRTNSMSVDVGIGMEVELKGSLFNIGTDAKFGVDVTYGLDCEWAQTDIDISEMSSSINTDERDLIGPGWGDLYWGSMEVLVWEVWTTTTTYADGTIIYSDPILYTGIDYSENVLVSRENAPASWLDLNPNINTALYSDGTIVQLSQINSEIEGGAGYVEVTHEEVSSTKISNSVTLSLSYETKVKLGIGSTTVQAHFEGQYQHDSENTDSVKTMYHIEDDDSEDYFHYDVGTDLRFGTPIFRNTPNANPLLQSKSSGPWEHGTRDVMPPEHGDPSITLDTDLDGIYPTEGDSPLIEVLIEDDAGISYANIIYSSDGTTWNTESLTQISETDIWYGNIPEHEHSTTIEWYIFAEDGNGNTETIKDLYGNNFEYTIISRQPIVSLDSPNLGGTYKDSVLIEWSGSDPDGDPITYNLGYRIDSGSWILIAEGLTNTSYLWDISGFADSSSVSVIVYADDGFADTVSDSCDFAFAIDNDDIPEVSIDLPLTGFTYGGMVSIDWTLTDIDGFVTGYILYYSITSGSPTWILIDDSIGAALETYDWNSSAIILSESVRLRLVAENSLDEPVEEITGLFTIDNRPALSMNLVSPNGGEAVIDNCTISWSLNLGDPQIDYEIKIEYSTDGSNWTTITSGITGTSYLWDISELTAGTNYRVKITLTASYLGVELDTIVDISENTFVILERSIEAGISLVSLLVIIPMTLVSLVIFKKRK